MAFNYQLQHAIGISSKQTILFGSMCAMQDMLPTVISAMLPLGTVLEQHAVEGLDLSRVAERRETAQILRHSLDSTTNGWMCSESMEPCLSYTSCWLLQSASWRYSSRNAKHRTGA